MRWVHRRPRRLTRPTLSALKFGCAWYAWLLCGWVGFRCGWVSLRLGWVGLGGFGWLVVGCVISVWVRACLLFVFFFGSCTCALFTCVVVRAHARLFVTRLRWHTALYAPCVALCGALCAALYPALRSVLQASVVEGQSVAMCSVGTLACATPACGVPGDVVRVSVLASGASVSTPGRESGGIADCGPELDVLMWCDFGGAVVPGTWEVRSATLVWCQRASVQACKQHAPVVSCGVCGVHGFSLSRTAMLCVVCCVLCVVCCVLCVVCCVLCVVYCVLCVVCCVLCVVCCVLCVVCCVLCVVCCRHTRARVCVCAAHPSVWAFAMFGGLTPSFSVLSYTRSLRVWLTSPQTTHARCCALCPNSWVARPPPSVTPPQPT